MKHWYCIHTKPGHEDQICRRLIEKPEMELFNPKLKKKKFVRGRLKEVVEGLFPCYIFSGFDLTKYYRMIKYTRGVRRIVGDSSGNPYIIDEGIIEIIRSRMNDGFISMETPAFIPGEQVVIDGGTFDGLTGIFLQELKASERVLILLSKIKYQARIQIDRCLLARA